MTAVAARLNTRVEKLERLETCCGCGLGHVPAMMTMDFIRSVIGPISLANPPDGWPPRSASLFLCDCCVLGRRIAELTHR